MVGCIYKYVCEFYIDIWQVWWNIYVCRFLKLASLSTLIFGRFFLKKKKKLTGCWKYIWLLKIYVCGFIYVENITVGRMWIYICWKYDRWQDAGSIENVTVVIVVEFEKKWLLERNDKERLKNNILIKWYWKCERQNCCWIWKKKMIVGKK